MAPKSALIFPLLLIATGIGWLLSSLGIVPAVDWIWVLGLGGSGLILLAVSGLDKVSVVIGPWLIGASILSTLRQTGRLEWNHELPVLVIWAGVLWLISLSSHIPAPKWYRDHD